MNKFTEAPLVSVIVPSYNHEKYMDDFMQSLIVQTYSNIELIIIDDCSTDQNSLKIRSWLPRLDDTLERVVFIQHDVNRGLVASINEALEECKGKYVKIIASDDMILPDAIEHLAGFLEENDSYSAVYSNGYVIDEAVHFGNDHSRWGKVIYPDSMVMREPSYERLLKGNYIAAPGAMIRKRTYEELGNYDEQIGIEDWEYWLRIVKSGKKIGFINEYAFLYRISSSSMTQYGNSDKGQSKFMYLITNELRILDKYAAESQFEAEHGIRTYCVDRIHQTLDHQYKTAASYLVKYCREKGVKLPVIEKIKYRLLKMGVYQRLRKIR